jgi:hypothetical protein
MVLMRPLLDHIFAKFGCIRDSEIFTRFYVTVGVAMEFASRVRLVHRTLSVVGDWLISPTSQFLIADPRYNLQALSDWKPR